MAPWGGAPLVRRGAAQQHRQRKYASVPRASAPPAAQAMMAQVGKGVEPMEESTCSSDSRGGSA